MSTGAISQKHGAYFQAIVPGTSHKVAFTNASAQIPSQMGDATTLVRVFATQDCWIKIGANPTAVAPISGTPQEDTMFVAGGIFAYFGVNPGQKLAVIRDSANGSLFVTEAK
jgi:hypothetical protein